MIKQIGKHTGCAVFLIVGTIAVFAFYGTLLVLA